MAKGTAEFTRVVLVRTAFGLMEIDTPTVETRFTGTFRDPTTDVPGLVMTDDGIVYLVLPDGTRVALTGGGGGGFAQPPVPFVQDDDPTDVPNDVVPGTIWVQTNAGSITAATTWVRNNDNDGWTAGVYTPPAQSGEGDSADIAIETGASIDGDAGDIRIRAGDASNGTAGSVHLQAGDGDDGGGVFIARPDGTTAIEVGSSVFIAREAGVSAQIGNTGSPLGLTADTLTVDAVSALINAATVIEPQTDLVALRVMAATGSAQLIEAHDGDGDRVFRLQRDGAFVLTPTADVVAIEVALFDGYLSSVLSVVDGDSNQIVHIDAEGRIVSSPVTASDAFYAYMTGGGRIFTGYSDGDLAFEVNAAGAVSIIPADDNAHAVTVDVANLVSKQALRVWDGATTFAAISPRGSVGSTADTGETCFIASADNGAIVALTGDGLPVKNIADAVDPQDAVTLAQLDAAAPATVNVAVAATITVTAGAGFQKATWAGGTGLLDLTDPLNPVVIEAGVYEIELGLRHDNDAGAGANTALATRFNFPAGGAGATTKAFPDLLVKNPNFTTNFFTVGFMRKFAAGATFNLEVSNNAAADQPVTCPYGSIVKVR